MEGKWKQEEGGKIGGGEKGEEERGRKRRERVGKGKEEEININWTLLCYRHYAKYLTFT